MNSELAKTELAQIELQLVELSDMMIDATGIDLEAKHKVFSSLCRRKHLLQSFIKCNQVL